MSALNPGKYVLYNTGTEEGKGDGWVRAGNSLSLDNHTTDTSDTSEVHGTNTVPYSAHSDTPTTACCLPGQ